MAQIAAKIAVAGIPSLVTWAVNSGRNSFSNGMRKSGITSELLARMYRDGAISKKDYKILYSQLNPNVFKFPKWLGGGSKIQAMKKQAMKAITTDPKLISDTLKTTWKILTPEARRKIKSGIKNLTGVTITEKIVDDAIKVSAEHLAKGEEIPAPIIKGGLLHIYTGGLLRPYTGGLLRPYTNPKN